MRRITKYLAILAAFILLSIIAVASYLVLFPPPLLQVGAGYSSKIVCSSAFLSGRDPSEAFEQDVLVADNPLLKGYIIDTDLEAARVRSAFLRLIAPMTAVQRQGLGCTSFLGADTGSAEDISAPAPSRRAPSPTIWPEGDAVDMSDREELDSILRDQTLAGPNVRAIVVVKDGRIVAERYEQGFDAQTRQLGWSMTKTITGAIVGTVIDQGKLSLDQYNLLPEWAGDERAAITVRQLLSMSSGLRFNESYGDVSDVNRMLFLELDMAAFAAASRLDHPPGGRFSYSTGSTVLLSRIWQNALEDEDIALAWPRTALFGPLGMDSAILEVDASGTFVGGSYLYATPRDWARFGQFLMNGGGWNGQQILSREYVELMVSPAETNPVYGQGHVWLFGKEDSDFEGDDLAYGVPEDAFWMRGHDGQSVVIIPSERLVVVRLGLTPNNLGYRPQHMAGQLVRALGAK